MTSDTCLGTRWMAKSGRYEERTHLLEGLREKKKSSEEWDGDQWVPGKPSNNVDRNLGRYGGGKGMKRGLGLPELDRSGSIMSVTYSVYCLLQLLLESRPVKALLAQ